MSVWYTRLMNKDPETPHTAGEFLPATNSHIRLPFAMLAHIPSLGQQQQQGQPHQQNQQNQLQGGQQQVGGGGPQQHNPQQGPGQLSIPPPPPLNGQDQTLSGVLHFLQTEWRRYERDRNEWEVERAEMRARIALLEGERRSFENVKLDLMRRIKMLEYALRMERSKQLSQGSSAGSVKAESKSDKAANKDDNQSQKGSVGSSPRSEDIPLPEQRLSISSLPPNSTNGVPSAGPSSNKKEVMVASWPILPNGNINPAALASLGKPLPGRDPKTRARSRDYLKQCLQELNYLTSPPAMNPLPNRPLLNNPTLPLSLPNLPSLEQVGFNGRPRKGIIEVGKDFPLLNGTSASLPGSAAPSSSGQGLSQPSPANSSLDKDQRERMNVTLPPTMSHIHQQQGSSGQAQGYLHSNSLNMDERQQQQRLKQQQMHHLQPLSELSEGEVIFGSSRERVADDHTSAQRMRGDDWKEEYKLAESGFPPTDSRSLFKSEEREYDDEMQVKVDEEELIDEVSAEGDGDSGRVWKARRTLRNHLDAVRAIAFHPLELCLATGGDDCTVKIWRMDPADLAAFPVSAKLSTEIEPQLTFRGHTGPITALAQSSSRNLLYSASLDSTIHVWAIPHVSYPTYVSYDSSRARGVLIGHTDAVWDLALARDDTILVSCGADGTVKVWNLSGPGPGSLRLSWGYNGLEGTSDLEREEEHYDKKDVGATALEPLKTDLRRLAVAYQDAVVKIFDIETGRQMRVLQCDPDSDGTPVGQVNKLASHPTMPLLVTAQEDKYIRIYDILTGQCTYSMPAHLDAVTSVSIDGAGFALVSGSHDCSIRFWDLINTRKCTQETQSHREKAHEGVLAVQFHPTLPFMASAGADGTVKLYASS